MYGSGLSAAAVSASQAAKRLRSRGFNAMATGNGQVTFTTEFQVEKAAEFIQFLHGVGDLHEPPK